MSFDLQPAVAVLQLRISLRGLSPPVWRRILVPEHLTLAHLHSVIQVVMGWTNEHLHQFTIRGRSYGEAHEGVLQFSTAANELTLAAFSLREHEDFVYVYDFDAWWRHDIRVERRMLRQRPGPLPRCVAGCGPCPPEDIGGIEAYLESKEERSEYEFLEWIESLREGPIVLDELRTCLPFMGAMRQAKHFSSSRGLPVISWPCPNARVVMRHLARDRCAGRSRRAIFLRPQPDATSVSYGIDIA